MHDPNAPSIREETADKSKLRDSLQSNCPFKSIQIMRVKNQGMFQTEGDSRQDYTQQKILSQTLLLQGTLFGHMVKLNAV